MGSADEGELAKIIPLHGRHEESLADRLREALADRGAVNEDLAPGGVPPKVWRTAARRAARDLGRPIRTGQAEHEDGPVVTVWAGLTDWPATPDEEAISAAAMRRTVDAMATEFPISPTLRPVTD